MIEKPMPQSLSIMLLSVSPIVQLGLIGGILYLVNGFRRSFGARRTLPAAAIVFASVALLLHSGYFAAPFLVGSAHLRLALWLITPMGVTVAAAVLWHLVWNSPSYGSDAGASLRRKALISAGLLVTYLGPVLILAINVK